MKQTTLDLNGPILGFSTNPQDVTVNNAGIATFVGIATATFPTQTPTNPASNSGIVTYRWYAAGIGALSDGTNTTLKATLSGTATTTLTVSSVTSSTNGIQFFVGADYIPSAYQSSSPVTAGTGRSTGNAINEILFSNNATLTVNPFISITEQPTNYTVAQGLIATFSVTASSSDNSEVAYQWYIAGSPVSNGLSGVNTISGATTNTLTIATSSNSPEETSNVYVTVSNPNASNSPVTSNTVTLEVVPPRAILNLELFGSGFPAPPPPPPPPAPTVPFVVLSVSGPDSEKTVRISFTVLNADRISTNFGYSASNLGNRLISHYQTILNITQATTYTVTATHSNGQSNSASGSTYGPYSG